MSAMFWMFFRMPLSSFRGVSGSVVGAGGGVGRRDTGRSVGASEKDGRTKVDGCRSEGDSGGGNGGGGGGGGGGAGGRVGVVFSVGVG